MTSVSISALKARLSAFLDIVRQGDEVLVTDRGRVIARLVPVTGAHLEDSRRDVLLRSGRLRGPSAKLPRNFWKRAHPADAAGRSLDAVLDERRAGF